MPYCKHKLTNVERFYTSPLDSGIRRFEQTVEYFHYKAPHIDSAVSSGIIPDNQHQIVFERLMKEGSIKKTYFVTSFSNSKIDEIGFSGNDVCIKCQRLMCTKKTAKETDLHALLRHLRNAFAHSRLAVEKQMNNAFVFFEDISRGGKISARMVVTHATLIEWEKILKEYTSSTTIENN